MSAYLPLLLMALLAVGTWWLVKNTPLFEPAGASPPPRHVPDYTMTDFTVQRFDAAGALASQIAGERLRHYPDDDTLEVDVPRIRARGTDGSTTRARARQGISDRDGSKLQLLGDAQVLHWPATAARSSGMADALPPAADALEFRGEYLRADLDTQRVRSHLPVTITRGALRLSADRLDYDNVDRVVRLDGRVRATFPPAALTRRRSGTRSAGNR